MNPGIRTRIFVSVLLFSCASVIAADVFIENSMVPFLDTEGVAALRRALLIWTIAAVCAAAAASWLIARWVSRPFHSLGSSLAETHDRLREERDLLQGVLNGMREGVLLVGSDDRVRVANPALRDMLLLSADVAGKPVHEVIKDVTFLVVFERAKAGEVNLMSEIDVGDLKPRHLLVNAAPLPDACGGVLAVFVDMTAMRRLETVRRDFVANVSHELRTPVASIRSAAETLRDAVGRDPEAALEFAAMIERNAERVTRLIDDLLDLSRIESREFALNLEAIEPGPAIDHVLKIYKSRAEERGIALRAEVPDGTPPAKADRRALEQVLCNLVENAIKYSPEGASVTVRADSAGGMIRISVQDTGPGIEARHIPRLFERFYRADAGRSREVGGTGLGLSIVKHLVEAMNGRVEVESVPGRGSAFSFSLPAA
ncbi:MAG: PAS domain-containing protein [Deltaproteobacteria bacterium]|nr:PAS domain-containing protein [Deltaproteobacteria bacterium]